MLYYSISYLEIQIIFGSVGRNRTDGAEFMRLNWKPASLHPIYELKLYPFLIQQQHNIQLALINLNIPELYLLTI